MVSVFRFRRYRTLIVFTCVILFGIYHLTASNHGGAVPAKFMKPSMPGRPPGTAAPVHSSSKLAGESTSESNIIENIAAEKPVKDINHDLEPAEDTAYAPKYPPVDENSVDDEPASTQEPEQNVVPQWKPLTVKSYESTYSPDDHRVDSNSITTPALPVVENIFKTPRITTFPTPPQIQLPEDPPISFPKIQGVFAPETPEQRTVREERLNTVRDAFIHSWNGYKAHAWGHDEVRPVTNGYADPFGGWGASIVDALDSLQIMGLTSELEDAKKFVASIDFTTSNLHTVPVFETVIRYLGGLISAYDLSNAREPVFLNKAVELADVLIGAFDTPNGMPILFYDPQLAHRELKLRAGKHMILAQFASLSLEFTRLAQLTANQKYYSVIQRVMDQAEASLSSSPMPGLWPLRMDISGCTTAEVSQSGRDQRSSTPPVQVPEEGTSDSIRPSQQLQNKINNAAAEANVDEEATPSGKKLVRRQLNLEENLDAQARSTTISEVTKPDSNIVIPPAKPDPECVSVKGLTESSRSNRKFSAGALGDSAYEYLIKQYLLLGGTVSQYKTLYETTSASIKTNLLYRPMVKGDPDILFSGNVIIGARGETTKDYEMTHLTCFLGGMYALGGRALELQDDITIGAKLADGCYWAYNATRTGIMPENFHVQECSRDDCHWVDPRARQTQPEYQVRRRSLKKRQEGDVVIAEETPQNIPEPPHVAESPAGGVSPGGTEASAPEYPAQEETSSAPTEASEPNDRFTQTDKQPIEGAMQKEQLASEKLTAGQPATEETTLGPGVGREQSAELRTEETKSASDNVAAPVQDATTASGDTNAQLYSSSHLAQGETVPASVDQMPADTEATAGKAAGQQMKHATEELQQSAHNVVGEPPSDPSTDLPTREQMKDAIQATTPPESVSQPNPADTSQANQGQTVDLVSPKDPAHAESGTTSEGGVVPVARNSINASPEGSSAEKQSAMPSTENPAARAEIGTVSTGDSEGATGAEASIPRTVHAGATAPGDDDTDRWEIGGWYDQPRSFVSQDARYLLRPEALESIFIMYRVTGDKIWQDKGWQMFSAINKYCRTATAFSAIADVTDNLHNRHMDEMESFWMAETLKYAYLLFADPNLISLDDYVFNTEAHPFLRPSPVTSAPE
ncbi:glycoside hydrolase [Lipomyces tetrasporus]